MITPFFLGFLSYGERYIAGALPIACLREYRAGWNAAWEAAR